MNRGKGRWQAFWRIQSFLPGGFMVKASDERSFTKSLFFGDIQEDMVFPYPALDEEKRARLAMILDSLRTFAQDTIHPKKIDVDACLP